MFKVQPLQSQIALRQRKLLCHLPFVKDKTGGGRFLKICFCKGAAAFLKPFENRGSCFFSILLIQVWPLCHMITSLSWCQHVTNFLKRKILSDDRASFLDLKSILILTIASFLIEINAKYLKKASNKKFAKSKFGLYFDGCSSQLNSHDIMLPLNSIFIFVSI